MNKQKSVAFLKNRQYYKFCFYGLLKNLRFFEVFFILFLKEAGLSYSAIGSLYALREITAHIAEIPTGIIADTYGRKISLIFSFILYIFSFVVFYFAGSYLWFAVAFVGYGIAEALRSGTHKAMIMSYLASNGWMDYKISYYGHTRSCSQAGSALSAVIAAVFVFFHGSYRHVFLLSVVPYVFNLLLVASYPRELNTAGKTQQVKRGFTATFYALTKSLRTPGVFKIINDSALHTAYLKAVKDYIQPLLVHLAVWLPAWIAPGNHRREALTIGFAYTIIYLLSSYASRTAGRYEKSRRQRANVRTLLYGLSLGLTAGVFYIFGLWGLSLIAFAGIFFVENLRKPLMTGYLTEQVPPGILTSVLSAQSLLKTLMTSAIALLFGLVADYYGIGWALAGISTVLWLMYVYIAYKSG